MVLNINCYFDDKEYYYTDNKIIFTHFSANEGDLNWKWYSDYQKRYLVLLKLFQDLYRDEIKNIYIYHDTRLIEEMKGVLPPLNHWGKGIVRYIARNVIPYFIDVYFIKKSLPEIQKNILIGREKLKNEKPQIKRRKATIAKGGESLVES